MHVFTVEKVAETHSVTYYRVSSGPKGGQPVTVRIGFNGVWACLGCVKVDCNHAHAAEDYARAQPIPAVA